MAKGIDYAFSPHPSANAIKAAGFKFVCRYVSAYEPNDHNGKNLLAAEKNDLLDAGLSIVLVKEEGSSRMLGGKAAGIADAQHASAVAEALGMPTIPIYFACDFDAAASQQAAINAYLDGAASVIGKNRVGIYGGFYPVKRALDAGKAKFAWQTYAWSGGQWDQRSHIRQTLNSARVAGASADYDVSMKDDFGQWPRPASKPPASPASKVDKIGAHGTIFVPAPGQYAAPASVQIVSATLALAWDAVTLDNEPAASYSVQAVDSSGAVAASITATTNSAVLDGLPAGKTLEIRIWANGGETSPPHASIKVTV